MSNKWGATREWNTEKPLYGCLFISRNKDNKDIEGFKPRRESFLFHEIDDKMLDRFDNFVKRGQKNELCRCYISVNSRNASKINKYLIHHLIDNVCTIDPANIQLILCGIAMKHENRETSRWLLDVDTKDEDILDKIYKYLGDLGFIRYTVPIDEEILNRIDSYLYDRWYFVRESLNGFHIITSRGFDVKGLDDIDVDVKRDDLFLYNVKKNI